MPDRDPPREAGFSIALCNYCDKPTVWEEEHKRLIWPQHFFAAPCPNPDMPDDIQKDYIEARSIANNSPRAAAALLRLSIEKLLHHLGEQGRTLDEVIGNLVKQGLPVAVQKALDIVRVTGNNAVHPGVMQLDEDSDAVPLLFHLVNFIIQDRISQPKEVEKFYEKLPAGAREAISKRDNESNTTK